MSRPRAFVDTNVLVSGLLFRGNESRILVMAADGELQLVLSVAVVREARRVFREKFPSQIHVIETFLAEADYESFAEPGGPEIAAAAGLVRDPGDAPILAGILQSKPDVALTRDKDLLTEEIRRIAPVMTRTEYLGRPTHNS